MIGVVDTIVAGLVHTFVYHYYSMLDTGMYVSLASSF